MKPIVEFVDELSQLGIKLWEEDGYLAYDMPKGVLTPTLRAELVARKTEILEVLRQAKQVAVASAKDCQSLPTTATQDGPSLPFPLSYGQQALWFIYQQAPQSPAYNMALPLEFRGDLNVTILQTVLSQLVRRHPMLRTTITVENDQPLQTVHASANLTGLRDLSGLSHTPSNLAGLEDLSGLESPPPMGYAWTLREATAWDEEMLLAQMHLDYEQPFELSQGPVLRAVLYRCTSQRHLLLLTMHHIFGDASSFGIFLEELLALYTGELAGHSVTLPPLPTSYADYIRWENDLLKGADGTRLATYWQTQLAGEIPVLNLPTDRPRPPIQTFNGASHNFSLTPELSRQVKALAQSERTTLFTVLLTAFQVLLHRYTGQTEIWVGTPTAAGRQPLEFAKLVGYLVNPVVLRATFDSSSDLTVRQLLAQTQQTVLNALDHQSYPFPLLVKQLQPHRDLSHAPLFQVMFDFQSNRLFQAPNSVMVAVLDLAQMDGQFDLTLTIAEGESLTGAFRYNADLFDSRTLARLTEHFQILLAGLVSNLAQAISRLPLLTTTEQAQLLAWNQTQTDYPNDQTIVDLFQAQVAKTPANIAVVFDDQHLTYQQLNAKANQLAHYLMSVGVTAETLVGICVERSLEMVIGVLGILKAGGAYVPLDPAYPQERLRFMLEDSQVPVLLSQSQLRERLPTHPAKVINLDSDWERIATSVAANPARRSGPANLAYVIYTSGSTGQPKGVMIEHLGLTNLSQALVQQVAIQANSQCLQLVSLSFDVATADLAMTLAVGATLHLLPNSSRSVGEPLFAQLQEKQITHLQIPVAVLATLTKAPLPTLQVLMVGGEACPSELVTHWSPGRKFINAYGPTETTVCATLTECQPTGNPPPIGKPIANTQVYILDAYHHPTPLGIPGELCIAGVGLARGYLNRPDLTAEKFIEVELFGKSNRVYKTGDLARWLPDGNLEYLGRLDHQIKLRGFRIELGEIEAVLTQHEAVKEAVVVLWEKETNPRLAAYVTLATTLDDVAKVLRVWLTTRLPDYMLPACFTVLEKLPLTPNGKIDRQALPAPDVNPPKEHLAPRTETERLLLNLWSQVLGVELTSIQTNFFVAGGHSLLATQLASRIRESFQVDMPLRVIFEQATLQTQAHWLDQQQGHTVLPPLTKLAAEEPLVLSFAQQWFWFLSHLDKQAAAHHMFSAWQLEGVLNFAALQQSFLTLIERHDNLRLCFPETADTVNVQCLPIYDPLIQMEVSGFAETEQQRQVEMLLAQFHQQPFVLGKGPLLRLYLLKLGTTTHLLWLGIHHIIGDAWSLGILEREWRILYTAYSQEQPSPLPPLSVQYTDYAAWQQRYLQGEVLQAQLDYWLEQLTGAPELLKLPTDYRRPDQQQNQGGGVDWQISKELTYQLQHLARHHHSTLYMVLFSTFNLLLYRYSGQRDICVGAPVVNRTQRQTEEMIGLFLNLLVLRTRLSPTDTFLDLLKQVRQQTLNAYAQRDVPFKFLVQRLKPQRQTAYNPYFQVMFNLMNVPDLVMPELPGLTATPFHHTQTDIPISNLDIVFTLQETAAGLHGQLVFDQALFREETIQFLANSFTGLLEQVVNGVDTPLHHFSLAERVVNYYPLSSSQREIWFDQILHEGVPLYNIGGYVQLDGVIEPELFEQAVNCLVEKHDTLRTILTKARDGDGIPLQTYLPPGSVKVPLHDFSGADDPHQTALQWMQQRFETPFDLDGQPLFRYDLLKLQDYCYYGLQQYHHLIVDGWAIALLNRSLAEIYRHLTAGQPPEVTGYSYRDYLDNDRAYLESPLYEKQRHYWLEQYPKPPAPLLTPRYRIDLTKQLIGSECQALYLPRTFYNRLEELAKTHQASRFQVLLGALYVYFTRTGRRDDLTIGLPILNRASAAFKQTAGLFTGVSPAHFDFGTELSFATLLQRINQTLKSNYRHQRFPISELKRNLGLPPGSRLFDLSLSYENHDYEANFGGVENRFTMLLHSWEQTPLVIFVRDFHAQANVKLDFVYNLAYFQAEEVVALQQRLVQIWEYVLEHADVPVKHIPLLTQAEVEQLRAWNQTQTDYPKDQTIVDLFQIQVEKTPSNVAVVFEDQQLTYRELNAKANQLAHYLMTLGVTAETLVGICVERSLEMVIGLLAILKAGGAYVPLDPTYPQERLQFMLEDSQVPVLLTQRHLQDRLPGLQATVINLDSDWKQIASFSGENLGRRSGSANLAYVIYTSGSTGRPKGVMVEHRNVMALLYGFEQIAPVTYPLHGLSLCPFSFDVAVWEMFITLGFGGTLHLVKLEMLLEPSQLVDYLATQPIHCAYLPPALLTPILNELETRHLTVSLRRLLIGVEPIKQSVMQRYRTLLPDLQIINGYGPTEATICATFYPFLQATTLERQIPIGTAVAGYQTYLLDSNQQPTPLGIPGELCIAGAGLARGYLNRPDLTAEQFLEIDLFGQPTRVYRTGDLARWRPDGNLEYLGRLDHQVKLRGFRIELGEIEAVLTQHEAVKEAVVVLREQDTNPQLAAYVTLITSNLTGLRDLSGFPAGLRAWLKTRLPDYMIPASFTVLEKLPLTPNGKIDRRALPEPDSTAVASSSKCVPPQTPTEQKLAQLWAEVLGLEQIGWEDNFFELGGHSLLALQLVSKIAIAMDVELSVKFLFLHPTIAQQAVALPNQTPSSDSSPAMMEVPKSSWQGSPFLKQEPRPLLSLFATGEIPPVDAAALGYLPSSMSSLLSNIPILDSILETPWGRIATIILPILDTQLYEDQKRLIMDVVKALKMAKLLGAKTVSLTGLLPSATNYGRLVLTEMTGNESHLPSVSTGHATTGAAVVLNIRRLLEDGSRDLSRERVAFLGVGSIGLTSLRLMLTQLPHPPQIMLCDVYHKRQVLEQVQEELVRILKFQGEVVLAPTSGEVPEKIYEATLIVGATNVPEVLDITQVRPGTLVIDDSAPHCFSPALAIQRFQEKTDILFTEGGVLQSPEPFHQILHSTPEWDQWLDSWLFDPQNITGCVFSSLLSARFELPSTLGPVAATQANEHYHKLTALGFQGSQLHCENYRLPLHLIEQFRTRFGQK